MEQMIMKNYGLILGFMAVLSGFVWASAVYAEDEEAMLKKNQTVKVLSKQDESKTNTSKSKKGEAKVATLKQGTKASHGQDQSTESSLDDEGEDLKPLDLSIPFQANEDAGLKNAKNQAAQHQQPNLFSSENNKRQRQLKLDGGFLMSDELEAEKQRSLDGAGIRLKLNP